MQYFVVGVRKYLSLLLECDESETQSCAVQTILQHVVFFKCSR